MTESEELEKRAEIALAQLGVAEDLAWWIAVLAAIAVYLKWDNWVLAVLMVPAGYFAITHQYRTKEKAAEDAHHRAAGLGKHYRPMD